MDIYLYHFNNYYNRRLKLYPAVEDYEDYEVYRVYSVNFNPNDGVITEHVIGADSQYNGTADYALVIENNQIISRWFIIENQRIRGGQYRLVLKRDTIADFASQVLAAPCFVEKGWVPDTDSAIFNSEQMTFNQIKKSEVQLQDDTHVPWLVGYYTKSDQALSVNIPKIEPTADITVNGIENWTYYNRLTDPVRYVGAYTLQLEFKAGGVPETAMAISRVKYNNFKSNSLNLVSAVRADGQADILQYTLKGDPILWGIIGTDINKEALNTLTAKLRANSTTLYTYADDYFPDYDTVTTYTAVNGLPGRIILDSSTGKYYKIKARETIGKKSSETAKVELTSALGYNLYNVYASTGDAVTGSRPTTNGRGNDITLGIDWYSEIYLELEALDYGAITATINPLAVGQTQNCPYNIFAIPFGQIRFLDDGENIYTSEALAMRTAMALIEQYSGQSGVLHDVQLLPYCPIQQLRDNAEGYKYPRIDLQNIPGYLYSRITDGESTVGYIFNCTSTSVQLSIEKIIEIEDYKIENETEFCRLVSPNWNGVYEFSPAKNRGLEAINVDLELKPFTPYIHLAPQFNKSGLYGKRDGDPIGLICGGDFGLTLISDAWATYERQNKNYQNIFNRQIQNLEVQHKYSRIQDIVGATVGTAQGAASGAVLGSLIGGVGAGVGAGVGGIASALGGIADYQINEQLRSETMDYTKDLFGYQLGNIKALPDSLTKVNSFNSNNTIFPILEFYGCTPEETEALKNKIKYNGMSIGRIGALKDFINPSDETYIKGQLILLDIEEDSHIVNDIAAEIYKGVRV